MNKKAHGFTIVELLIVIVVIAILAAISIVAFINIRQRANVTAKEAEISQIKKAFEVYSVEHGDGEYRNYPYHAVWGNPDSTVVGVDNIELPTEMENKITLICQLNEGLICGDKSAITTSSYILGLADGAGYALFYWDDVQRAWRQDNVGPTIGDWTKTDYAYKWVSWEEGVSEDDSGWVPCDDPTFEQCSAWFK